MMPFRLLRPFACGAIALLVLANPISADEGDKEKEHSPLHEAMEEMGGTLRKLKRQIANPDMVDSSKELLAAMRKSTEQARELGPPEKKGATAEETEKWKAKFRENLGAVIKTIDQAEAALKESKFDGAAERIGELTEQRNAGHEEFGVDDD